MKILNNAAEVNLVELHPLRNHRETNYGNGLARHTTGNFSFPF